MMREYSIKPMRWFLWAGALTVLLFCVVIISLCVGSVDISLPRLLSLSDNKASVLKTIVFQIRLPRIILGFAIGGSLSLAGLMLQGLFRNPLVEPYTLGISGGAALGVALNTALKLNRAFGILSLPISGFAGAVIIIALIYILSLRRRMLEMKGLLLTGVMISFISSSLIMFIMAVSSSDDIQGIVFWIMGSLGEPNWILIKIAFFTALAGLLVSYLFCIDLNALSLGEEAAAHLGINVNKVKRILFLLASILTGYAVSVAGIIGFVGLLIPHFMRILFGRDYRILIITSFLAGASFLIASDTLARTIIAPLELPVGVITGMLGGGLFIYVLSKKRVTL